MVKNQPLTVSQLVFGVKEVLEGSFRQVMVEGEISNLSSSAAGHWYFTLSDDSSSVSCALFRGDAMRNPIMKKLKDGDKVICLGPLSVYTRRGTFQLVAKKIQLFGKGDLKAQFEILKQKLASEGLFDLDRKRPIPTFPKRVAVITAEKGAALQDFLNVYKRRGVWVDIVVVGSLVQGDRAAQAVSSALERVIKYNDSLKDDRKVDTVVVTRGGGSIEDLWCFNDEALARVIADYPLPLVSAVGHQVDFTICDFVADLRSETPTAAAEMLTNNQYRLRRELSQIRRFLEQRLDSFVLYIRGLLSRSNPNNMLGLLWKTLTESKERLQVCRGITAPYELLNFHEKRFELDDLGRRLETGMNTRISNIDKRFNHLGPVLEALNPNHVLKRGFVYLESSDGKGVIKNYKEFSRLSNGHKIKVKMHGGEGNVEKISK